MGWTEQEVALNQAQRLFGRTAYTENHMNYRLVGVGKGKSKVFCIGQTWDEAITGLERRLKAA